MSPKRTRSVEEIDAAIEKIKAQYSAIRQHSIFGHDNWAERDYLVALLEKAKKEEYIFTVERDLERDENQMHDDMDLYGEIVDGPDEDTISSASSLLYWLEGGKTDVFED